MAFNLSEIELIGRSLDEYRMMFDLDLESMKGRIVLDVGAGVSSFCAEARKKGVQVFAVDNIYKYGADELKLKCREDLWQKTKEMSKQRKKFIWDYYKNIEDLRQKKERACEIFTEDYITYPEFYVYSEFPVTYFRNKQFDYSLISHILFLYEEKIDYEQHKKVLKEAIKISRYEVRIYPITNEKGKRSVFVDQIIKDPLFNHVDFEIVTVDYEFVKNSNEMLRIIRKDAKKYDLD